MVEIAKALRSQARVLILDEPTAVLSQREIDHLFRILRDLRERGLGLVYVSHRLDEIFEICTDICVLKDGEITSAGPIERYDHDTVVAAMVGRSLGELFPPKGAPVSDRVPVLSVRGLAAGSGTARVDSGVDLDVRPGEIVGLAGLVGSGRTELALAIYGATAGAGTVELHGTPHDRRTPGDSLAAGMAMLTENRKADGLFPNASVAWNLAATTLGKGARALALSPLDEERRSRSVVERFSVVVDHVGQPISALSGGNQQKVLMGRLLENAPRILLLDEPTRGVDIATKAEIYRTLRALGRERRGGPRHLVGADRDRRSVRPGPRHARRGARRGAARRFHHRGRDHGDRRRPRDARGRIGRPCLSLPGRSASRRSTWRFSA